jgi:phage terminase small subunit
LAENLPIRPARGGVTAGHTPPSPPRGLTSSSRRLWVAINAQWLLDAAALPLLQAALESKDRYEAAGREIRRDGPTIETDGGRKVHPAHQVLRDNLREFRQIMRQLNLEVSNAT